MEGFSAPKIKERPTDEPEMEVQRESKIIEAGKNVVNAIRRGLDGTLDRVVENPYFENEREF
jgi:hypothetical protein